MTSDIDDEWTRENRKVQRVAAEDATFKFRFPTSARLKSELTSVLDEAGICTNNLIIVDRKTGEHSTFPVEIITCQISDGQLLKFFCKYEAGRSHTSHGHRAGVAYEVDVYRWILQPLAVSTPRLIGAFNDVSNGGCCMVLEHLGDCKKLRRNLMNKSASWIGKFHNLSEIQSERVSTSFLIPYDHAYYKGWIQRTLKFSENSHSVHSWLPTLCSNAIDFFSDLSTHSRTVIHGEYYPGNIFCRLDKISPLDWETAAVGIGEIDLAMLTDRWPRKIVDECESQYRIARWSENTDPEFEHRLMAARLYVQFRWLGDKPEWTAKQSRRFEKLRSLGEKAGLIAKPDYS
jgi:hypothetical protein